MIAAHPRHTEGAPPFYPEPRRAGFEGASWSFSFLYIRAFLSRALWLAFAFLATLALTVVALTLAGCGYHVAGRSDALPQTIHVIAVPALENATTSYRIEQRFTAATVHEFLAKTRYKVVSNANDGDAVLRGKILSLEAVPLLFDTTTGRSTTMLVTIKCEVTLTQSANDKVLYHTDNFLFRSEYEISAEASTGQVSNPQALERFFQEQDPALDRLARDFATRLVAAVTENF